VHTYWSIFICPTREDAPVWQGSSGMKSRPLNQRLGQILVTIDAIDYLRVMEARLIQMTQTQPTPIGQILVDLGYISNDDLKRALSLQNDLDVT
jgi:hypothetical protein